ncbi:MAG TPA: C25 family cysteine peptidase, partial [Kiritimatiellia bacterium]|nr:C25 family cysteine peptidase [Kiritimatiellia bacterium]
MKKILWIGMGGWLVGALAAAAATVSVDFTFAAGDVTLAPAGHYVAIGLTDGARVADEIGAPAIPARFVNVLLPARARNVSISAAAGTETLLAENVVPYPAQPRSPKSKPRPAFAPPNARYAAAEPWPAALATQEGDHDMQGYRFVSVRVNPLVYVGAEKKLYLRERMTVTASYDVPAAAKSILPKQARLFGPLVDSLVVNPSDAASFAPAVKTVAPKAVLDYLIITSPGLSNAFQRIADYRATAAGGSYTTRVLTTNYVAGAFTGTDIQAKIRACISNQVATLGTTMVLLGGDDTIVPDRNCAVSVPDQETYETNMPTDLYYSGLNGSWNSDGDARYGETTDGVDLAWDVVVARLPMRTAAQVTNYLNRVVAYEAGTPATNKIMLGGPSAWLITSGTNRPSDDVTGDGHAGFRSSSPSHVQVSDSEMWLRRLYRDGIRSNWPAQVGLMCDTITSWDGSTCGDHLQSAANTVAAFNRNWTHLMFSGHGAPQVWGLESGDFTQSNASDLTGLTAFVYTDACMTGAFDGPSSITVDEGTEWEETYTSEPCLGEGFLRNARPLGGALAYMGCARFGWGEPDGVYNEGTGEYEGAASNTSDGGPSTVYAYKFYKRMYETTDRTLGVAFAMHKADMAGLSASDDCERWIQFGMNLLGDPALRMPGSAPAPSAPNFAANPGPLVATVGVARAFTVSASGNPAPVLALQSQTASAGYGFVPATGVLTYTAPGADLGARSFTFRATNALGAATQTVAVTVVEAPPAAPAAVWAAATNATDFTAAWSASS